MNNKGKSIKINPLKEISPCYKCLIRYVGCHDECAGYLDWKQRCSRDTSLVIWIGNRDVSLLHISRT